MVQRCKRHYFYSTYGNWPSERKGDLPKVIMASRFRIQTRICVQRLCSSHLIISEGKSPSDFSTAIELYKKQSFLLTSSSWFSTSSPIYVTNTDLPWISPRSTDQKYRAHFSSGKTESGRARGTCLGYTGVAQEEWGFAIPSESLQPRRARN